MDSLIESAGNELIIRYGLAGIVIFALACAICLLYKENSQKNKDINDLHVKYTETILAINSAHDANIERVTNILTSQIKESNEVGRQDRLQATQAFNKMGDVISNLQMTIKELTVTVQSIERKNN